MFMKWKMYCSLFKMENTCKMCSFYQGPLSPSVYLGRHWHHLCDKMDRFVYAYCKRSKPGQWEDLGPRLRGYINILCIYAAYVTSSLISVHIIQHFEHNNVLRIYNRVMLDFSPRLLATCTTDSWELQHFTDQGFIQRGGPRIPPPQKSWNWVWLLLQCYQY